MAFASASASSTSDVPIHAYWSAERKDVQTTDWDLATLNQHGGNYTLLGTVGYLASSAAAQGSWQSNVSQTPLFLGYSAGRADGLTAPTNTADANALAVFDTRGGAYAPSKQRVVGYGREGGCPVCNTGLAAAYPSRGGADCPTACASGTASFCR